MANVDSSPATRDRPRGRGRRGLLEAHNTHVSARRFRKLAVEPGVAAGPLAGQQHAVRPASPRPAWSPDLSFRRIYRSPLAQDRIRPRGRAAWSPGEPRSPIYLSFFLCAVD